MIATETKITVQITPKAANFSDLAVLPELKDRHGNHRSLWAGQQNRHRKLFGRQQEDEDPAA